MIRLCSVSLAAAALVPALLFASPQTEARDVTLTGDPWPPYVEGEIGKEADKGLAVMLVRRIFEEIDGFTPRFPLIPWKRALREVEQGTMDGIVILAKTPERERYMVFSEPLITARSLVWYTTKRFPDGFQWSTLDDFSHHLIGIVRGYNYGSDFVRAVENDDLDVVEVTNVEQLFDMLARGRIDLALANDNVGYGLARSHAAKADIRAAKKETTADVYYIGFSRRSEAAGLVDRVNEVIRELRAKGIIDGMSRVE